MILFLFQKVNYTSVVEKKCSLFADVEVEVVAKEGSVYYDLKCGEEKGTQAYNSESQKFDGETITTDEYFFWMARSVWGMQNVELAYAYYQDGEIHVKYTSDWDPGYWYGFQVFYKDSTQTKGNYYRLSCKINVDVDCTVTLNGTVVELHQGDNNVEVFYQLSAGLGEEGTSSFDLALGYNDGSDTGAFLKDGTVVISDIQWEEITSFTTLQAPSFQLSDDNVITITDTNTTGVGAYNLVFFQDGVNKGSIEVKNGEQIDTSTIEKGTYTVKLQAIAADVRYLNSDFSETSVQLEITAEASYALPATGANGALATPGKWTYYKSSWVTITDNNYSDGVVTFGFSNNSGNWDDTQLYYKAPNNVVGKVYMMSFDLELDENSRGHVVLSGHEIMLESGSHHYEVVITESNEATFAMIFALNGQLDGAQEIQAAKVVISNLTFSEVTTTALQAPSFTIDDSNVITITDANEAANVSGYVLGFFTQDNELACRVAVKNGEAINLDSVAKGTYTVRLLAQSALALYTDSDWSTVSQTVVSTTENPVTNLAFGENGINWEGNMGLVITNPDTWYYWNDQGWNKSVVEVISATMENGVVTASIKCTEGSNPEGFQLFHDVTANEAGKTYTLKLTITATADTAIKVNGKGFDLVANEAQNIEVVFTEPIVQQYAGASISIQFSVAAGYEATITVAEMTMVEGGQQGGEQGGETGGETGETVDSLVLPADAEFAFGAESDATDKLLYWYVKEVKWNCGSVVTMNTATYQNGVVTLSYVGGDKDFSVQLFYRSTQLTIGKNYKVTLTINSDVAGTCRVNGKEITLNVGDNTIDVEFTAVVFTVDQDISALDIQFNGSQTQVTYKVSNVSWEIVNGTTGGEQGGETGGEQGGEQWTPTVIALTFVEVYNDVYMHFTCEGIPAYDYVKVNGTKAWNEFVNGAFKVCVGEINGSATYTFEFVLGEDVVATATYEYHA